MSNTVVVASGYFNPLHYGHVSFLEKARDVGSTLVVIVNNDVQAARKLGSEPGFQRHGMPVRDRVRLVRSLACVDAAVESIDNDDSVCETLKLLHPDVFANGGTQTATEEEAAVCRRLGIRIVDGLGTECLLLKPFTQHYDWGKARDDSVVAALAGEADFNSPCGAKTRRKFAELWMGDHPSGPSSVRSENGAVVVTLGSALSKSPNILGTKLGDVGRLPFLLKVLSIEKALSIQAHPDRALAARLHEEYPEYYKDANHKPEIAIALSDFEALCGFRPFPEFSSLVEAVPELQSLIGDDALQAVRTASGDSDKESAALKAAYSHMMHANDTTVQDHVQRLVVRAKESSKKDGLPKDLADAFSLSERLCDQFGNDVGIFSVFFLNYVKMQVGECLYMPQNTPHAYLSGDIVECMACSDNVVRGGLTPKFKHVKVLCDMLVYRGGLPPSIKHVELEPGIHLYASSELEEFQVHHVNFTAKRQQRVCFSRDGPALGFVFNGEGALTHSGRTVELRFGVVFLLAASVEADLSAATDLEMFVASCPPAYFGHHQWPCN
eukprot:TRINITY_DN4498_c0_g1_i1.p1 TRINITY_DN4498_c0_g1~~TRINITY_DN4498_c0_g1_i1.p1  ORF type:complete len:553 (+),score=82.86 TRINITY_DN4498_c0_g1_i1:77-1735(+)